MIKIGHAFSTSDNDQVKVKAARKDYVDLKSARMFCENVTKNKKDKVCLTNFCIPLILKM